MFCIFYYANDHNEKSHICTAVLQYREHAIIHVLARAHYFKCKRIKFCLVNVRTHKSVFRYMYMKNVRNIVRIYYAPNFTI